MNACLQARLADLKAVMAQITRWTTQLYCTFSQLQAGTDVLPESLAQSNLCASPALLLYFQRKSYKIIILMANRWSLTKSRGPAGGVCGNRLAVAFEMGVGSLAACCLLISPTFSIDFSCLTVLLRVFRANMSKRCLG